MKSSALQQQLTQLAPLVDPKIGIIKHVYTLRSLPGESARVHIAGAQFQDPYRLPPRSHYPEIEQICLEDLKPAGEVFFSSGAGFTSEEACLSATGGAREAIARSVASTRAE